MQNQVSLFTTVTWVKGKVVSKAVMSDCMQHTKTAVVVFLDEILQNIPIDIGEIRIWTAGPASQLTDLPASVVMEAMKMLSERCAIQLYILEF